MSKSRQNAQRLVLKINSKKIRYANWDFKISLEEAKQNEELVSLGDSQVLRMIRQIRNNNITEEEILNTKERINILKRLTTNEDNKNKIKEEYEKLTEQTFIEDYVVIVFDNIDDWNKANSNKINLKINDKEFVRLLGTSGGIKKNSVVFVNKEIHEELDRRLNCKRNTKCKYVPAKFEAYKSLACSSSTPVPQPRDVLVIKDGETNFIDKVLRLSDNGEGGFNLAEDDNYEITRAFTDGCGMISPELSMEWTKYLCGKPYKDNEGNDVPCTGYNLRNAWTKGMAFTFPYVEYGDMIGEYLVEDYWGDMVDIRTVDLVITDNMLKLAGAYNNRYEYLEACKECGFEYCVAKVLPETLECARNMNYQFLQSYELSDEDIDELIRPTVDMITGAIGYEEKDFGKMLLFMKGENISKKDFTYEENLAFKSLMIEPRMMKDPYLKGRVYNMIKKKINDSKKGVIQVRGNYQIVSGDLYAMCQHMFKKEVTGLLGREEFYSREWLDKGVNEIVSFRAPMTVHNNIVKMKLIDSPANRKWYRYMRNCIILNAWDTTCDAMNGCDFDGDAFITTDNPVLLRNTKKLRTLMCEQKSAEKKVITEPLLRKANKNGFGNDVGLITNRCTAMFDVLAKFEKDSIEYKEMMYRISCMQGYQQEIIDSCKGIVPKKMPRSWYEIKGLEGVELELVANKKPYFFIYNYKHIKAKWEDYLKDCDINSRMNFGMEIKELLKVPKEERTEEMNEFMYWFNVTSPVSDNDSTMNKICHALEDKLDNLSFHVRDNEFDKHILMTKKSIKKTLVPEIMEIYNEYKNELYVYMKDNKNEDRNVRQKLFEDKYREKIYAVCNNEEDLANILVNELYDTSNSKQFIWAMVGEYLVDKLLKDNNYTIKYPVRDDNGEIEWNGTRYSIIEERIDE